MPSLCTIKLQKFSLLYIKPLYNDCSHIENVHLPFCEHFMNMFSFFFIGGGGVMVGVGGGG